METKKEEIRLRLNGWADIMFDRFYGQEKDTRPPEQKFYLDNNNRIVLPAENIYSFLFAENPPGCAKAFEGKRGKEYIRIGRAFVFIDPGDIIPFKRDGKDIIFEGFEGHEDIYYITEFAPRTKQGNLSIKQNMKQRPALKTPWSIEFAVTIFKNSTINRERIYNWFSRGGIELGIGTYRPRYGSFEVEVIE